MKRSAFILLGLLVFILLLPWTFDLLYGIMYVQMQVVKNELAFTKPIYGFAYRILFGLKLLFFLLGVISVLYIIARRIERLFPVERYKEMYFTGLLFLLLCGFIVMPYGWREVRLRQQGYQPGVFYKEFRYNDSLVVDQYTVADSVGRVYFARARPWFRINSDGYVSDVEYETCNTMLIGDSYLEGVTDSTAINYDSVAIRRLLKKHPDDKICAFGVGGTSPVHYALVAEKYIPHLKPKQVVVLFYAGNDVLRYETPATPYIPPYYDTNCGRLASTLPLELSADKEVVFSSAKEAYDYYVKRFTLQTRDNLLAKWCANSCLLTGVYRDATDPEKTTPFVVRDSSITYQYLKKIKDLTEQHDGQFAIVFIPKMDELLSVDQYREQYQPVFKELTLSVFFPQNITAEDYLKKDSTHFNHTGNRHLAENLDSVILRLAHY